MNCNRAGAFYRALVLGGLLLLAGCGGSGSPSSGSQPETEPVSGEELAVLPQVSAGGRQFADPNVLVVLRGSAAAAAGATIVSTRWTQIDGPEVTIPRPQQLQSAIVVPDLQRETELAFRLTAEDSEGRVNSSVAFVYVRPNGAFARVIGSTVNEADGVARFIVRLNAPQATEIPVDYATRAGTAEEGSDYLATQGRLLFAPGETEQVVSVTLFDSDGGEDSEYFSLDITVLAPDKPSSNSGITLIVNNPDPAAVNEIAFINPGPITVALGETVSNAIDPASIGGAGALSYEVADAAVAGVDQQGLATALAVGTTTITAIKAADATSPRSSASYELVVVNAAESLDIPVVGAQRVTLGLALFSGTATIDWNDGSPAEEVNNQLLEQLNGAGSRQHDYALPTSGNITITFSDGLNAVRALQTNADSFQFDVALFSGLTNVEVLNFSGQNATVNGLLSSLSGNTQLRELQVLARRGNFSGDIAELPPALTVFTANNSQSGAFSGRVVDIPDTMVRLFISVSNTISGDVVDIPAAVESFYVAGANTITGVVAQVPANVVSFTLLGANTLAGNIEDLHPDMVSFNVAGQNTIGGDLSLLRNNGNLFLSVSGINTITTAVAAIPTFITSMSLAGNNTVFGNIEDLHPGFNSISINGLNTIGGDLGLLVNAGRLTMGIGGRNTISGVVADIPSSITSLSLRGDNTLSGNIQDLHTDIVIVDIGGFNTIAGDLGLLQNNRLTRLTVRGDNTIDRFTSPPVWSPAQIDALVLESGGSFGFDANTVDSLLIFLDGQLGNAVTINPRISLRRFGDEPRTAASDAAVDSLTAKGYVVLTNEFISEPI